MGIVHRADVLPQTVDWGELKDLAEKQGLSAIALDGIEILSEGQRPPKVFLLEWIGETLQGYEYRYELYQRAIAELAGFYNSHGCKMMVLKGYACSLDWPKPEHRPCGDIDIWLFGKQKEADTVLAKEMGVEIDNSHHHHTVFNWMGFTVENHYDFVNVLAHRSSAELEKVFKELGKDDSHDVMVNGNKVYLPSVNLHALFMLRHAASHFVGANISLRQVLDWVFFVEKHNKEIDWKWLNEMLEKYNMKDFYNCINAICVEDLGFNPGIFQGVHFDPVLKDRVLNDILCPAFSASGPMSFPSRMVYKLKRWKGNSWKHSLCFNESLHLAFWDGILAKIRKPGTI